MSSKKILIQMSGSIAAFKICTVISKLVQLGHHVKVAVSTHALNFIGESTLEGLSQNQIHKDTFTPGQAMDHIHQMRWADIILAAPATANYINKIANGIGDDLLTTQFLAHDFKKPFLIAPAMNTAMYLHPVTQESIAKLRKLNIEILETESGVLACGEVGWGRLMDPELILKKVEQSIATEVNNIESLEDNINQLNNLNKLNKLSTQIRLKNKILITAGGTQEPIDAMRVITNLSTGSTGTQLANYLSNLGFDVTLLKAKNSYNTPSSSCTTKYFQTFKDLQTLLSTELQNNTFDVVIHAAAVSDFYVSEIETPSISNNSKKLLIKEDSKIQSDEGLIIKLKLNPKLISSLKSWSANKKIKVIGFKYTASKNYEEQKAAVMKLFTESKVDAVVHNDHSEIDRDSGKHSFTFFDQNIESATKCTTSSEIFQKIYETLL